MEIYILTCNKSNFDGTFSDPPWSDEDVVIGAYKDSVKANNVGHDLVAKAKKKSDYSSDKWTSYEVKACQLIE